MLSPCVIEPFAIEGLDTLLATHSHSDHIYINVAAAVVKNCPEAKFVEPKTCIEIWRKWGVPEDRLVQMKPGDEIVIEDSKIKALESFDRTRLLTIVEDVTLKGNLSPEMDGQ